MVPGEAALAGGAGWAACLGAPCCFPGPGLCWCLSWGCLQLFMPPVASAGCGLPWPTCGLLPPMGSPWCPQFCDPCGSARTPPRCPRPRPERLPVCKLLLGWNSCHLPTAVSSQSLPRLIPVAFCLFKKLYLFIHVWLCWVSLTARALPSCGEWGCSYWSVWAAPCGSFPCCGAGALGQAL